MTALKPIYNHKKIKWQGCPLNKRYLNNFGASCYWVSLLFERNKVVHSFTNVLHMFSSHSQIIDTFLPLNVDWFCLSAYSLL